MELLRRLSPRLAALGVVILLAACGGEQRGTPIAAAATATPDPAVPTATPAPTATPTPRPTVPPATATPVPTPTPTPPPPLIGLDTELVASGLRQPVFVTGMPGTDLLLVIEREGVIKVVDGGTVLDEPFLDLRDRINSSSIEQGLLGLAFHPTFVDSGRFFAYWTQTNGDSRLAEFALLDDRRGDPDSMRVILDVEQPGERHNAGMIQFDPDGNLFLSLGDGGAGGRTSQDTTNLLGTLVRLDVDGGDPYAIPADNPFGLSSAIVGVQQIALSPAVCAQPIFHAVQLSPAYFGFKPIQGAEHQLPESQCLKCNPGLVIERPPKTASVAGSHD